MTLRPDPTAPHRHPAAATPFAQALALATALAVLGLSGPVAAQAPGPAAGRPAGAAAAAGDPLPELRRLVEASQFEAAYTLARAHPRRQGDPHFDFLFGIAAVNTGRVPEGLLALERHLAVVPANDRARLELARGYFLLGEYARARAEFEFVLRFNPPPAVRANIRGFLDAMQLRDSAEGRASSRFYVEAGAGHDSNVNGGTFRDRLDQAFGGSIDLRGTDAQGRGDAFGQLAAGVQQQWSVTPRFSVFASVDADLKANQDERAFDLGTAAVQAGFTQLREGGLWRLTLGWNTLWVGGNPNRSTFALGNEWQWALKGAGSSRCWGSTTNCATAPPTRCAIRARRRWASAPTATSAGRWACRSGAGCRGRRRTTCDCAATWTGPRPSCASRWASARRRPGA
jgi:tetratricopeptide (TPR) repeat protein